MGYPLGWSVVTQTLVRRERWPGGLKAKWTALVYPGQEVQPDQPVMRMEMTQLVPEKTAVPGFSLRTATGGAMDSSKANSTTGTDRWRSGETIPAGIRGRVVDVTRRGGVVIESRAAVVQGAIGAGCQVASTQRRIRATGHPSWRNSRNSRAVELRNAAPGFEFQCLRHCRQQYLHA